jgi:hypothetical protein
MAYPKQPCQSWSAGPTSPSESCNATSRPQAIGSEWVLPAPGSPRPLTCGVRATGKRIHLVTYLDGVAVRAADVAVVSPVTAGPDSARAVPVYQVVSGAGETSKMSFGDAVEGITAISSA